VASALKSAVISLALLLLTACASVPYEPRPSVNVRRALAPTGTLRIAVLNGAPTSMVRDAATGRTSGLGYELGAALATRLGVPYQVLEFGAFAEVATAIASGQADFAAFNASSPRASEVWVAEPLFLQEAGYLVPAPTRIGSIAEIDQPGVRVGVQQNSTSQGLLTRHLRAATVVPVPSLQNVPQMFATGQLDAFATNKGILFDLSDRVPGSRVLAGNFSTEHQSVAIPKGRDAGVPFLTAFLDEARRSGMVKDAVARARLRGVIFR
jgi:polar amino acid transport system substrate-binding protein